MLPRVIYHREAGSGDDLRASRDLRLVVPHPPSRPGATGTTLAACGWVKG
jgi:hypothetical protein